MTCDKNCFACLYADCINDELTAEEYAEDVIGVEIPKNVLLARERANRYARKHREENRQRSIEHYYQNKEKYNEQAKQYAKDNKGRVAANKRKRYQKKKLAILKKLMEVKRMGVTVESKNCSMDLGYFGFNNLRTKVAELTGKEIGVHYQKLTESVSLFGKERVEFFKEYNKKISELEEKYKIPHGILDFLYASDCDGKLTYGKCKQIYKVIKDYDDDILYGYSGIKDCAMFQDFKEIIKDCVDNKCAMEWC